MLLLAGSLGVPAQTLDATYANVEIPDYDPGNPEHFLIRSPEDWSHIDDDDKRVFYVQPHADYGTVTITASGSRGAERIIALHDASDLHPAKLTTEEQANVRLRFFDADHWIVHRMSCLDATEDAYCYEVGRASRYILLDQLHLHEFFRGIRLRGTPEPPHTEHVTIQQSRFDQMSAAGIDADAVAVMLAGTRDVLSDTRILGNEFRNCNDGVMLSKRPYSLGRTRASFPGTIIDGNHFYVDTAVYTDGRGRHDPTGNRAWTENAIDLKSGSDDPDAPVVVSNNYMWGYRRTDTRGGGSGSWGAAVIGHFFVKNVVLEKNVIFDSNRAIAFSGPRRFPFSVENASVVENVVYDIGPSGLGRAQPAILFHDSRNVTFARNTIVGGPGRSRWFDHRGTEEKLRVRCNVVISAGEMTGRRAEGAIVEDNFFYATPRGEEGDGVVREGASDAGMTDLTFTTDRYSGAPRAITIPGVLSTDSSPHVDGCFEPAFRAQPGG